MAVSFQDSSNCVPQGHQPPQKAYTYLKSNSRRYYERTVCNPFLKTRKSHCGRVREKLQEYRMCFTGTENNFNSHARDFASWSKIEYRLSQNVESNETDIGPKLVNISYWNKISKKKNCCSLYILCKKKLSIPIQKEWFNHLTSNIRLYFPSRFLILKYDWHASGSSPGGRRYMSYVSSVVSVCSAAITSLIWSTVTAFVDYTNRNNENSLKINHEDSTCKMQSMIKNKRITFNM